VSSDFGFRIKFVFGEEIGDLIATIPFKKIERAKNLELLQVE
jgi:hypothetical protein